MSVVLKNNFVPLRCQYDKVTSFINNLTTTIIMKNEIILLVLKDVRKHLEVSVPFAMLDADSPFFSDSCKVVEACHILTRLIDAIKFFNVYVKD